MTLQSNTEPLPFEEILAKIEQIVQQLDSSTLPLEEALKIFEEGVALSRMGSTRLEEAERRIEEILKDGTLSKIDDGSTD